MFPTPDTAGISFKYFQTTITSLCLILTQVLELIRSDVVAYGITRCRVLVVSTLATVYRFVGALPFATLGSCFY